MSSSISLLCVLNRCSWAMKLKWKHAITIRACINNLKGGTAVKMKSKGKRDRPESECGQSVAVIRIGESTADQQ